jgi:hypothetical protein
MLCKKTSKNQITLPKRIVERFSGIDYFDAAEKDGAIVLTPAKVDSDADFLAGIRAKMSALGVTDKDISDAIAAVRKAAHA